VNRRNVRNLLRGLTCAATTCAVVSACALGPPGTSTQPSPIISTPAAVSNAQTVLSELLATQPNGKALAAAAVTTSFGTYIANLPPESKLPSYDTSSNATVIVLKVYGSFPHAHRGPAGANTDSTTIIEVYDTATDSPVEVTYLTGPEPADLAGSTSKGDYIDLRDLGAPEILIP
jgi:hypothetical protein